MTTAMLGDVINDIFCIFMHSFCGVRRTNHEMGLVFQSPFHQNLFPYHVLTFQLLLYPFLVLQH